MDAAVGSFLEYLGVERGSSPHTLRSYATDLTEFTGFLAAERVGGLAEVDARVIRAYLARLHQRRLSKASLIARPANTVASSICGRRFKVDGRASGRTWSMAMKPALP